MVTRVYENSKRRYERKVHQDKRKEKIYWRNRHDLKVIHSQPIPDPTQVVQPVYNPHIDWDSLGEQYVRPIETWKDSQFRAENARNKACERGEENIRFA